MVRLCWLRATLLCPSAGALTQAQIPLTHPGPCAAVGVPDFGGAGLLDSYCCLVLMLSFELDRGRHAKRRVMSLLVVPDLEVFENRVRELDAGAPLLAVQQLDLHARSARLDHRAIEAVAHRTHRRQQPRGERRGGGLGAVVATWSRLRRRPGCGCRSLFPMRWRRRRGGPRVDRLAHHAAAEGAPA